MQNEELVNNKWRIVVSPPFISHCSVIAFWFLLFTQYFKQALVIFSSKFAFWRINQPTDYQSRACFFPSQSNPPLISKIWTFVQEHRFFPNRGVCLGSATWHCVNRIKTITWLRWRQSSHIHETNGHYSQGLSKLEILNPDRRVNASNRWDLDRSLASALPLQGGCVNTNVCIFWGDTLFVFLFFCSFHDELNISGDLALMTKTMTMNNNDNI